MSDVPPEDPIRVAFVRVQNAGRSQMAQAFAERARARRDLEDRLDRDVEVRLEFETGGTDPSDGVHSIVVEAVDEAGIDPANRTLRAITSEGFEACDVEVTMGRSAGDVRPVTLRGDARDWHLEDPRGKDLDEDRAVRDDVEARVDALIGELEVGARV